MKELSCILLQLEFDNYERNCQPEVLSQIADKDLVSSEFWSRFSKKLLIDLIESFLSNSSPLNKEIFFQSRQKTNASEVSIAEAFLHNSRVTLT